MNVTGTSVIYEIFNPNRAPVYNIYRCQVEHVIFTAGNASTDETHKNNDKDHGNDNKSSKKKKKEKKSKKKKKKE